MMNTKIVTIAALSLGLTGLCSAQTSSPSTTTGGSKTSTKTSSPASATSSTTTTTTTPTATTTTTSMATGAPYVEGPVWTITMVKTKSGMSDDYLRQISQSVKPVMEEEKRQKLILDYKILEGDAMGAQDFNILIMVQFPNMAALDGLRDKTDPIVEKVMGSEDQRRAAAVKRLDIREILGTKTMREITLK